MPAPPPVPRSGPPGGGYAFGSASPFLYWSGAGDPTTKPPVTVSLDAVFATPPTGSPSWGPFELTAGDATLPWLITGDADVWTFDGSPLRSSVVSTFDSMLDALDDPNGTPPMKLKGGRSALIRSYLGQALPQTFAESLYFRYGLDPVNRWVDLVPGMRLRIEFQAHQAVDPESSLLNGFVGSGTVHVNVTQRHATGDSVVLAFDPFLEGLQGMTVQSSSGGAGGTIDLQGSGNAYPYWRLVYPSTYVSGDSTGRADATATPSLVAANTRAALSTSPAATVFFRGRVAIVPEIPVMIDGENRWVALGMTARDVLSGQMPVPWNPAVQIQGAPSQFLTRPLTLLYEIGTGKQAQVRWSYQAVQVPVLTSYKAWDAYTDTLDVPLVGGDQVATYASPSGQ